MTFGLRGLALRLALIVAFLILWEALVRALSVPV